jgi:hypothetical protein
VIHVAARLVVDVMRLARILLALAFASGCSVGTYVYLDGQIEHVAYPGQ